MWFIEKFGEFRLSKIETINTSSFTLKPLDFNVKRIMKDMLKDRYSSSNISYKNLIGFMDR